VFSLVKGADERVWVGYEGLLGLPEGEPIEGIPSELDVYDVEVLPRSGTLLATLQQGVVLLQEGELRGLWPGDGSDGAYAIAQVGEQYLAAGAGAGLVTLDPQAGVTRRWGPHDGLPSSTVNEVVPDTPWVADARARAQELAGAAWVGTDQGLARLRPGDGKVETVPLAALPAGSPYQSMSRRGSKIQVAGDAGLAWFGPGVDGANRRAARLQGPVVAMLKRGSTRWIARPMGVEQRPLLGRARVHQIPGTVRDIIMVRGEPWVASDKGLYRFLRSEGRFAALPNAGPSRRLRLARDGTVWAISADAVLAIDRQLRARPYMGTHRPLDLSPDEGVIWVGTDNGIDVIHIESGEVLDVLRSADRKVVVPTVAADGKGGCWVGTAAGQLLHLGSGLNGGATIMDLVPEHPPQVRRILALDDQRAFALTDQGVFAIWRPTTSVP